MSSKYDRIEIHDGKVATVATCESIAHSDMIKGANWFFWIAALSLINSVVALADGEWSFIVGLGITQFIDGIAWGFVQAGSGTGVQYVALFINVVIVSCIVTIGYFARQGKEWSFIAGLTLYVMDTLMFVLALDYVGIAFHCLALYFIFKGYKAIKNQSVLKKPTLEPAPEREAFKSTELQAKEQIK